MFAWSVILAGAGVNGGAPPLPAKAPGPHVGMGAAPHRAAPTFRRGQPVIATSYFYWYAVATGAHIRNADGSDAMTTHPADMVNLSYKRPSWHEQQLRDVTAAGIDVILPVFWGVPGQYESGHFSWSFLGISPLVEAHDSLTRRAAAGRGPAPPLIGLFYDTSILRHNNYNADGSHHHVDLSTEFGREWFYTPIRDFFSLVPPEKWARVDGRPIVFLYAGSFAKERHPDALDHARKRFREDFGVTCFIVKHRDWLGEGDAQYQWGGALALQLDREVAALGPGYDHSAVPGRTPLVVDRRDGAHYSEAWSNLLALAASRRPWLVHVETWSEWHEGTDIAESREYGRQYIELTRAYADRWHAKAHVPFEGALSGASEVRWPAVRERGLKPRASGGDGVWRLEERAGAEAIVSTPNEVSGGRYLYFEVSSLFAYDIENLTVDVTVTYLDRGCQSFAIEYDNTDMSKGPVNGAFRHGGSVRVGDSGAWKTAVLRLRDCWFINRCNGADFRFAVGGAPLELAVREVTVRKVQDR